MRRILLLLVTLMSFSVMAKPEKDFQLYCKYAHLYGDKNAVFKFRNEGGATKITGHILWIRGHYVYGRSGYELRNPLNDSVDYKYFTIDDFESLLKDADENKYYFGENMDRDYPKYKYELNRKTLVLSERNRSGYYSNWECSLTDNENADEFVKVWEEWQKEFLIKYPKPKPLENKI